MNKWEENYMSNEEIVILYSKNAKAAAEATVEKYSDYIHYVINLYFPTYRKSMDLFQSGVEGMLKALRTYNPEKGCFTTYCTPFIKKECSNQVRFESGSDSEYFNGIHTAVTRAKTALEASGKKATVKAIMDLTNLSEKIVKRELGVDYVTASYDLLANSEFEPEYSDGKTGADEILSGLTERERLIVKMKVIDMEPFEKIAEVLHKDVYIIEEDYKDAIEKLRKQIA